MQKVILNTFLICGLILWLLPASALKLDGHVFVGQQVINDLEDDGKISIELNGRTINIPINTYVKNAILNNKTEFLMGNLGPDVFPDVIVGQTTVHPGVAGGMQTNDWLEYLLAQSDQSEKAKAFAYGYLGHASTDVFAHTYVNQYSGDVFEIFDEILVEERHFVLEGFIDQHLPPLKDYLGNNLPEAYQLLNVNDEFAIYLRNTLISNDFVQAEYNKTSTAKHLAEFYSFRKKIQSYADNEVWNDMDVLIAKYVAAYWGINLTDDQANSIVNAANSAIDSAQSTVDGVQYFLNNVYNMAAQYEQIGFDKIESASDKLSSAEQSFVTKHAELMTKVSALDSSLRSKACSLFGDALEDPMSVLDPLGIVDPIGVAEYILEHDPILNLISGFFGGFFGSSAPPTPYVIWRVEGTKEQLIVTRDAHLNEMDLLANQYFGIPIGELNPDDFGDACGSYINMNGIQSALNYPGCRIIFYNALVMRLNSIISPLGVGEHVIIEQWSNNKATSTFSNGNGFLCGTINDVLDSTHKNLLNSIQSFENDILDQKQQMRDDLTALHTEITNVRDTVHDMENTIIDFTQSISQDLNPIQSYLKSWVADIDLALKEYVKATGQTMINTIDPNIKSDPNLSALEPIKDWVKCYNLSLVGLGGLGCEALKAMESLQKSISLILDIAKKAPLPSHLRDLMDDFELAVANEKNKIENKIEEKILELLPQELQDILALTKLNFTDADLNFYFTKAETTASPKNLVMIADMAERVKAEMQLQNGLLDPTKFPLIRNAIVLSKLALLDVYGLQYLAVEAGLPATSLSDGTNNIVATAFKNIDGNHQWMEKSPPIPNAVGEPYRNKDAEYGTHNLAGYDGFLPWKDNMRNKLFNALFIGPLSSGIDYPIEINKDEIVPDNYPYNPCTVNPYPSSSGDQTCIAVWLIPIITGLLL